MDLPVQELMYRYEDVGYSRGCDEWDNPLPGYTLKVELREYLVVRKTPKGVWITNRYFLQGYPFDLSGIKGDKFILAAARKRYACPTKEEALESFKARKETQVRLLSYQLNRAEQALKLADTLDKSYTQF